LIFSAGGSAAGGSLFFIDFLPYGHCCFSPQNEAAVAGMGDLFGECGEQPLPFRLDTAEIGFYSVCFSPIVLKMSACCCGNKRLSLRGGRSLFWGSLLTVVLYFVLINNELLNDINGV
jgi:hypothetical protein